MAAEKQFNNRDNFYLDEAFLGINNARTISQFNDNDNYYLYVDILASMGTPGTVHFLGFIDASTNPDYPAANKGDQYEITVKGKVGGAAGLPVEPGDLLEANVNTPAGTQAAVGTNWIVTQFGLQQIFEITGQDLAFAVQRDLSEVVGRDFLFGVIRDSINTVGNNYSLSVTGNKTTFAGGNSSDTVSGTYDLSASNFAMTTTGMLGVNVAVPLASIHSLGQGATSATQNMLLTNSAATLLMAVRNDGFVGVGVSAPTTFNGGGVGQLECGTVTTTLGSVALMRTAGANYIDFENSNDLNLRSIDIGGGSAVVRMTFQGGTSGHVCIGDGADGFFSSNTNRLTIVQSAAGISDLLGLYNNEATAIGNGCSINFYTESTTPQRKLAGAVSSITTDNVNATFSGNIKIQPILNNALVDAIVAKSTGTVAMASLQVGNAGLVAGDLYVDTAANILVNADLVVARKV